MRARPWPHRETWAARRGRRRAARLVDELIDEAERRQVDELPGAPLILCVILGAFAVVAGAWAALWYWVTQ